MLDLRLQARFSLGSVRQWHWISSAACLVGMLMFALTGITLNHAGSIPATPRVHAVEARVPAALLGSLAMAATVPASAVPDQDGKAPLPAPLRDWLADELDLHIRAQAQAEWSELDVYLPLPRPGGDAWLSLDLETGELLYERTDRGWISYFNDLHKGRDSGSAWRWFIDAFAAACVVFCLTGLWLLIRHGGQRPATWPSVALGLVLPLLLIILFVH